MTPYQPALRLHPRSARNRECGSGRCAANNRWHLWSVSSCFRCMDGFTTGSTSSLTTRFPVGGISNDDSCQPTANRLGRPTSQPVFSGSVMHGG
jgi:hypothetical protein